jgi:hypothetical protein
MKIKIEKMKKARVKLKEASQERKFPVQVFHKMVLRFLENFLQKSLNLIFIELSPMLGTTKNIP